MSCLSIVNLLAVGISVWACLERKAGCEFSLFFRAGHPTLYSGVGPRLQRETKTHGSLSFPYFLASRSFSSFTLRCCESRRTHRRAQNGVGSTIVVSLAWESPAYLTACKVIRVHVDVGRVHAHRLDDLCEAGRSAIDSLGGTGDDVGRS